MTKRCREILATIRSQANEENRAGMARYGINVENAYGVGLYALRPMAKELGRAHTLALELWDTGNHEARLLAAMVDEPDKVTRSQMNAWARGFDSWDVCDIVCTDLFDRTPHAWAKAVEWAGRKGEFVKRAGFTLVAGLAVHDKAADDTVFERFLPIIEREADDERNFVWKAVNWALRNIGKRNAALNAKAVSCAERVLARDTRAARRVARDALRELQSDKVQARLRRK